MTNHQDIKLPKIAYSSDTFYPEQIPEDKLPLKLKDAPLARLVINGFIAWFNFKFPQSAIEKVSISLILDCFQTLFDENPDIRYNIEKSWGEKSTYDKDEFLYNFQNSLDKAVNVGVLELMKVQAYAGGIMGKLEQYSEPSEDFIEI